jgi:hypothetical protein
MNPHIKELAADAMEILHECRRAVLVAVLDTDKDVNTLNLLQNKLTDLEDLIEQIAEAGSPIVTRGSDGAKQD